MDELQIFQVMSMLLSDRPNGWVDGIIFHGRSFNGDDDGLFELISDLVRISSKPVVMVNGGNGEGVEPESKAWLGSHDYEKRLIPMMPLGGKIVFSRSGKHTFDEGLTFSEKAEELGWKSAIVVAQPFQLLRIMLTHLEVMRDVANTT